MSTATNAPAYPWLRPSWERLNSRLASGRLAHANLLLAADGVGMESLVEDFVRALLCEAPSPEGACAHCRACHLLHAGTHPDLLRLELEEGAKQLKIDQIRSVTDFVNSSAHGGIRKVVIIDQADRMNPAAANALLKNLEEPSGDCVFLLTTFHPFALLPTLRSRCQKFEIPVPSREESRRWLSTQGLSADDADRALDLAALAPLRALQYARGTQLDLYAQLRDSLCALSTGAELPSSVVTRWKADPDQVLGMLLQVCEDLIRSSMIGTEGREDELGQHWKDLDCRQLFEFRDRLLSHKREAGATNLNPQMLLRDLSLDYFRSVKLAKRTHSH